jgi:hypothetical protein
VILRKLDDDTLPTKAPNKLYSGNGSGATCDACGDTIIRVQVEYELNYPDEHRTLRLHLSCAGMWEAAPDTRARSRVVSRAVARHDPARRPRAGPEPSDCSALALSGSGMRPPEERETSPGSPRDDTSRCCPRLVSPAAATWPDRDKARNSVRASDRMPHRTTDSGAVTEAEPRLR